MAQIIKHRRGSVASVKNITAKNAELIVASGSISDLSGPFVFIGSPNSIDEGSQGAYSIVSKIYQGTNAPTLSAGTYGSTLDGTPFYASGNKSLYVLNRDNVGNTRMDLTGNIEGNTISGVTINDLESTNVTSSFFTGSFIGDGTNLYNIPASGVTGLQLSKIYSGSVEVNTDSSTATITLSGATTVDINSTNLYTDNTIAEIWGSDYAQLASNNSYVFVDNDGSFLQSDDGSYGLSVRTSGEIEVTGSLYVSNNSTFNSNVYVTGLTENRLVVVGANGLLEDDTNLVFDGNKLQVGQGQFEVDVNTGDIRTSGSITMKGNITIGDNPTGDTININGEISSSLIPSGSNVFDLGSETNYWNDLYVSGTAYVGVLNANTISLSGITVFDDLVVSGSAYLGQGGGDNIIVSGSMYLDSLTQNRVVYVGVNGQLVDSSSFTFDGSNLNTDISVVDLQASDYSQLNWNDSNYVYVNSNGAYLESNDGGTYLESYGGQIYLNNDSGNEVNMYGHTYIRNGRTLYGNTFYDESTSSNMLELYGWGTDDGYWWEHGNSDTTLWNSTNQANLNIVQTNNGNVNIDALNGSVNLHSANGFNVTGSMIVSDASGVFNSSLVANNSNLTLNNGSNLDIQDNGTLTVDGDAYFHNDAYFTGNTYSDNYHGLSQNTNALHLNGGSLGASQVELASVGQISLFSEGSGGSYAINLTGSVYANDNVQINNGNTLYTNYIYDVNGNDLNIGADGNLYLYSDTSRNVEIRSDNAESGTNYLWVQNNGVGFQTYDISSDNNHTVYLDNTGSLKLTNVDVIISGSLGVDGNTTYNNDLTVGGDLYVSGNFTVLGTGSIITLSGSQVDIGTNKIILNTYAPFERFAGIDVYDSGSNAGVTGSLLWDSQENVWVYANPSGSSYASARLISGPMNTGSLGEETGLTTGHFPIAVGDDHISDSLLTYLGTTLALNTNKFTVDSASGDTLIAGNFTIEGVGDDDNGNYSSYIVFRNDNNVLGFVDTQDTENVTDRLLGYNASTGVLEFSSLIDGGTY